MPIGFPSSPTTGQQWPTVNPRWEWDGVKWVALPPGTPVTTIKPTPVGADRIVLLDSAADFAPVLATLASLPGGGGAGALVTVTHNGGGANPVTGDTLTAAFAAGYTGSVQWQRNGSNISGATNPTYMAVSADEGATVRPQVTSLIYTATGLPVGAAAATVPGALVNGTDWDAQPTATAGEMQYQINALPSNGGSPITALEYRVNTGSAIALTGTGTGNRTVTAGWSAGVAADTQVRAVNAIGAGPWSTPPLPRTPASASGPAYISQAVSTGTNTIVATLPAGVTASDRLFAIIAGGDHGADTTGLASYAGPTGWTPADSATAGTNGTRLFSAPGNVSDLTFSATNMRSVTLIGVTGTLRDSAMASRYWDSGGSLHTSPSADAGAGDLLISIYIQQDGTAPTFGAPTTDYTPAYTKTDAAPFVRIATRTSAPAGATGDISAGGGSNFSTRVVATLAIQA